MRQKSIFVFFIVTVSQLVYGFYIPDECMKKCGQNLGDVTELSNPNNIDTFAKNIDQICGNFTNAAECAKTCTDEEQAMFAQVTSFLKYACVEQRDTLSSLRHCMGREMDSVLAQCKNSCGDLQQIVADNRTPSPVISETAAVLGSMAPLCKTLKCTAKCLTDEVDDQCPGAGQFFRDLTMKQVEESSKKLTQGLNGVPLAEHVANAIKQSLPAECSYMLRPAELRDYLDGSSEHSAEDGSIDGNMDENQDGNKDGNQDENQDENTDENQDGNKYENQDGNQDENTDENQDENKDENQDENKDGQADEPEALSTAISTQSGIALVLVTAVYVLVSQ